MEKVVLNPVNLPLQCELVNNGLELRISIGVETLKFVAENHPDFWNSETDKNTLKINNPVAFAEAIVEVLNAEQEDGSSVITDLIDRAIKLAVEDGAEGIDYDALDALENEHD